MMEKEIIEGNKLIAKFMGAKIVSLEEVNRICKTSYTEKTRPDDTKEWIFFDAEGNRRESKFSNLAYHSSWDWLMPVMEKIGQEYNVRITWCADGGTKGLDVTYIDRPDVFDKSIADFGGYGAIINTWKCAVKFIEWHNYKFRKK